MLQTLSKNIQIISITHSPFLYTYTHIYIVIDMAEIYKFTYVWMKCNKMPIVVMSTKHYKWVFLFILILNDSL